MLWYVASSWKNAYHVENTVRRLRQIGQEAYDFTHHSFNWADIEEVDEIDVKHVGTLPSEMWYSHPMVTKHYAKDMKALNECDALVALFPAGNSTHIEIGFVAGRQKPVYLISGDDLERDLLYLLFKKVYSSIDEFIEDQVNKCRHG